VLASFSLPEVEYLPALPGRLLACKCCATDRQRISTGGFTGIRFIFETLEKEIKMTGLMVSMLTFITGVKNKLESEKGATAVEYGLLVALVAAIIIGVVTILGTQIQAAFQTVVDGLPPVAPKAP
jgi:pilus assembly protein Flp/PilA